MTVSQVLAGLMERSGKSSKAKRDEKRRQIVERCLDMFETPSASASSPIEIVHCALSKLALVLFGRTSSAEMASQVSAKSKEITCRCVSELRLPSGEFKRHARGRPAAQSDHSHHRRAEP